MNYKKTIIIPSFAGTNILTSTLLIGFILKQVSTSLFPLTVGLNYKSSTSSFITLQGSGTCSVINLRLT